MSDFIQTVAEHLRDVMDRTGATFEQMERALSHACNADGGLNPSEVTTAPLTVRWSTDANPDPLTEQIVPAQAALDVWRRAFNRGPSQPDAEQPCVFEVVDPTSGRAVRVDLALPKYREMFPGYPGPDHRNR